MSRRVVRLLAAYVAMAVGVALTVRADLGVGPWDVFHQGVSRHTPLSLGGAASVVGALAFLAWWPLRRRPGPGTVCNVLLLGPLIDLAVWLLPATPHVSVRVQALLLGTVLIGVGVGAYLSADFGTGPRDGIMMGLVELRGWSVGRVRLGMESGALLGGWLLGGTVGVGTLVIGIGIGPVMTHTLTWFRARDTALAAGHPQGPARVAGPFRAAARRWDVPTWRPARDRQPEPERV